MPKPQCHKIIALTGRRRRIVSAHEVRGCWSDHHSISVVMRIVGFSFVFLIVKKLSQGGGGGTEQFSFNSRKKRYNYICAY